jgi:hypothetical protein
MALAFLSYNTVVSEQAVRQKLYDRVFRRLLHR